MIQLFRKAFQDLSVSMTDAELARLADQVHLTMTASTRIFHNVRHVFGLSEGMKPLQVLAAIFHDVVYYQIDGGLPEPFAAALANVIRTEGDTLILQPIDPSDRATTLCAEVFGFCPGQVLMVQEGMNEFLSAVVAVRLLQQHLTPAQLMTVAACIEVTIPFRGLDCKGQSAVQALAQRLQALGKKFQAELCLSSDRTADFVKRIIVDAIDLANQDVSGFTRATPVQCLSNTWLLLKESNAPLAVSGVHSMLEYRNALLRMRDFLENLDATQICQAYEGYPEAAAVAEMNAVAEKNILFCCDYLDVEISFVAILEALGMVTGVDCPSSLLLGEITANAIQSTVQSEALPIHPPAVACDPELHQLLEQEVLGESVNRLTPSPYKHLVYQFLGIQGNRETATQARNMFNGALAPRAFLETLNPALVNSVISACSRRTQTPCSLALVALQKSFEGQHGV